MAVQSLRLQNFTVFADARFDLCPGVNVLLGENGTGKSHALKAAYAMGRTLSKNRGEHSEKESLLFKAGRLFEGVFAVDHGALANLEHRRNQQAWVVDYEREDGWAHLEVRHGAIYDGPMVWRFALAPIFLPPREVLSMYPNFRNLYEKYELAFDATYYDLVVTLGDPVRRKQPDWVQAIVSRLEAQLGGKVVRKGEQFVVQKADGELEISLEAEGLRKLATLLQLLYVGALEPGGMLLWDEPEANMNPRLLLLMKELLLSLARAGVQILLATHDYLLSRELSLAAEYEGAGGLVRFFCLHKPTPDAPVQVESGATLSDLPHDPLVAEFSAQYDRQAALFNRPPPTAPASAPVASPPTPPRLARKPRRRPQS
jgi:hypothetical protein